MEILERKSSILKRTLISVAEIETTASPEQGGTCPSPHGGMVSKDIPLNGGWIHILCNSGGQVGRAGCIFIHKVRAGCTGGNPIDAQMHLVSLNMNEGRGFGSK